MKIFLSLLFSLFLHSIYALPADNPAGASLALYPTCSGFSLGLGFYGDYVFNRHMRTTTTRGKDIDTTKLFTNAAYLDLNLCDRLDIFTTLGASRLSLNTSLAPFNALDPHPLFEIESSSSFSYSIGARVTLYEWKCLTFGLVGQYFSVKPNIKRIYIAAGAVAYPGNLLRTHYSEDQVALGVAYGYNSYFIPYLNVRYAHARWKLANGRLFVIESNTNTFLFNLRNQRHWGAAIGLTLDPIVEEKLYVTTEFRFPDEKAFYVNALMRF
jgi:opacity protein-like surface antigen